ncbi:MAG TPA: hypothetical protein VLJ17_11665 [Xanthobacteraceae bacterium]|nr:hypothetical protein [Xanthobacteraceae bacterium]
MLDYLPVGSHGDPVLDFSQLTRDQAAALVEVTAKISLTAVARTPASFVGSGSSWPTGSTRWSCSETL